MLRYVAVAGWSWGCGVSVSEREERRSVHIGACPSSYNCAMCGATEW